MSILLETDAKQLVAPKLTNLLPGDLSYSLNFDAQKYGKALLSIGLPQKFVAETQVEFQKRWFGPSVTDIVGKTLPGKIVLYAEPLGRFYTQSMAKANKIIDSKDNLSWRERNKNTRKFYQALRDHTPDKAREYASRWLVNHLNGVLNQTVAHESKHLQDYHDDPIYMNRSDQRQEKLSLYGLLILPACSIFARTLLESHSLIPKDDWPLTWVENVFLAQYMARVALSLPYHFSSVEKRARKFEKDVRCDPIWQGIATFTPNAN